MVCSENYPQNCNMPDRVPENRIHLFDPVGLIINDGVHPMTKKESKCYDGLPLLETNNRSGGVTISYDDIESEHNKDNSCDPRVDPREVGFREEIPMYTAISRRNGSYDYSFSTSVEKLNMSSPRRSLPSSPLHRNGSMSMSPKSRTEAIAKGRKELMDMVRDLPDTYYELSLKDIVEKKADMELLHNEVSPPPQKKPPTKQEQEKRDKKRVKNTEKKKSMGRSKSGDDHGKFLLKTSVFPIMLGSNNSSKSLGGSGSGSFKIAPVPKTQPTPTRTRSKKGGHPETKREWWWRRRRSCISTDSNGLSSSKSSTTSSSTNRSDSNSSNGRHSSGFLPSCCFFKGRNEEHKT